MNRRVVHAIRHVGFEHLGSFARPLARAGYDIEYLDAATRDLGSIDPLEAAILVILGGPIGVYKHAAYPILDRQAALLRARLAADRPTLGICLGAQLIAAALGSRVRPGPCKEIGWECLTLTGAGKAGPLGALDGVPVLHWHGDTFDLPAGCDLLASTASYRQQAFARGRNVLGLQFHAEPLAAEFEHWLIGHACELAGAGIDPNVLRTDASRHAKTLEAAAEVMLSAWLDGLEG